MSNCKLFGCKYASFLILAFMLLTSCNNEKAKILTVGHCVIKESDKFIVFSQGANDLLLSSPQPQIMVYIKNNNSP